MDQSLRVHLYQSCQRSEQKRHGLVKRKPTTTLLLHQISHTVICAILSQKVEEVTATRITKSRMGRLTLQQNVMARDHFILRETDMATRLTPKKQDIMLIKLEYLARTWCFSNGEASAYYEKQFQVQ